MDTTTRVKLAIGDLVVQLHAVGEENERLKERIDELTNELRLAIDANVERIRPKKVEGA